MDAPSLAQVVGRYQAACATRFGLSAAQRKVCGAITACRTPKLGGQQQVCMDCGTRRWVYHSCRNRHCPKCQTQAKVRWLDARLDELLPVPYFHLVFTLPHTLNRLLPTHARWVYDTLFACASQTLLRFGQDPQRLNGTLGITLVLHTWAQDLTQHVHVHGIVTGGALTQEGCWVHSRRSFLFPVRALSKVYRACYIDAVQQAWTSGEFAASAWTQDPQQWQALIHSLHKSEWVVYAKPPFGGPRQVLDYLGRYTHKVAISEHRLKAVTQTHVQFQVRNRQDPTAPKRKTLTLEGAEFLRRFLLHVLPHGFQRLRHYGITASRCKQRTLALCRQQLNVETPPPREAETVEAFWLRVTGRDILCCPRDLIAGWRPPASDRQSPARTGPAIMPPDTPPLKRNGWNIPARTRPLRSPQLTPFHPSDTVRAFHFYAQIPFRGRDIRCLHPHCQTASASSCSCFLKQFPMPRPSARTV